MSSDIRLKSDYRFDGQPLDWYSYKDGPDYECIVHEAVVPLNSAPLVCQISKDAFGRWGYNWCILKFDGQSRKMVFKGISESLEDTFRITNRLMFNAILSWIVYGCSEKDFDRWFKSIAEVYQSHGSV